MALPDIVAPAGTPAFLASGHAIALRDLYAAVRFGTGAARKRRLWTAQQRIVSVQWLLEAAQLAAVEEWYEQTLDAGAIEFAAQVAPQGPGPLVWWRARWVEFSAEIMHKGRATITGRLLLTGAPDYSGP